MAQSEPTSSVADVWIISDTPVDTRTALVSEMTAEPRAKRGALPSNAAENLYWLGRYVDRAEGFARLNRAYHSRLADAESPSSPLLRHLLPQYPARLMQSVSELKGGFP